MTDLGQYYTLKRKILFNLVSGGATLVAVIVNSSLMRFYTDAAPLPCIPCPFSSLRLRAPALGMALNETDG